MKKVFYIGIIALAILIVKCAPKTTTATQETKAEDNITKVEYTSEIGNEEALTQRLSTSLDNGKIPVIYFSAGWCGPCRSLKATFPDEKVQTAMKDVELIMVDVDKEPDLATKYGVRYIPYLIKVDKNGKVLDSISATAWGSPTPESVSTAMTTFLK